MLMLDDKMKTDTNNGAVLEADIEISEKQIEIFARRLLPDIKQYFSDEKIKAEFKEWQKNNNNRQDS